MNVIELKPTNYESITEQINSLVYCLNYILKGKKNLVVQDLVIDFVTDFRDNVSYFLQIKYLHCVIFHDASKLTGYQPRKTEYTTFAPISSKDKDKVFECAGDYCNLEDMNRHSLPVVH